MASAHADVINLDAERRLRRSAAEPDRCPLGQRCPHLHRVDVMAYVYPTVAIMVSAFALIVLVCSWVESFAPRELVGAAGAGACAVVAMLLPVAAYRVYREDCAAFEREG